MTPSFHIVRVITGMVVFLMLLPLPSEAEKDSVFYEERMPSKEHMEKLQKEHQRYFRDDKGDVGDRSLMAKIRTFIDRYFYDPIENASKSGPYLRYFLIVIGIGLILAYFIRNGATSFLRSSAVEKGSSSIPFTPMDLEEEGPLRKARNAEEGGALVEALRWRYIYIVQILGQKGLVRKSPHRTDREYYSQLRGTGLEEGFLRLANYFQLVRYGDRPISEADYEDWKEGFKELERRIKQYEG